MPKVAIEKSASEYPCEIPAAVVEDLRRWAKSGDWLTDRAAVARAIWLFAGWANSVLHEAAPIGEPVDARMLHELREAVHAGVQAMKGQSGRPLLAGGATPDASIGSAARILESDLTGLLTKLAFLKKIALEN